MASFYKHYNYSLLQRKENALKGLLHVSTNFNIIAYRYLNAFFMCDIHSLLLPVNSKINQSVTSKRCDNLCIVVQLNKLHHAVVIGES